MKICTKCGTKKEDESFRIDKNRLCSWCRDCEKIQAKKRRELNKEHDKEVNKRWNEKNKERVRDVSKKWRDKNKELCNRLAKQWRDKNREKVRAQTLAAYYKKQDYYKSKSNERYYLKREECLAAVKEYRMRHPEKKREIDKAYHDFQMESLPDGFVKTRIKQVFGLSDDFIKSHPIILEIYRNQLKLKRHAKKKKTK
jgi:hypothetical protein